MTYRENTTQHNVRQEIGRLIDRGALFMVNHSGGKDSQAMTIYLRQIVPPEQLLVIHAHLPEVDWDSIQEHIEKTIGGLPLIVCQSVKTFFQMVEHRGVWPSPQQRQCTSDLKRGPIEREVRRHLKAHPEFNGLIVNCMGIRAEESPNRAKATVFKLNQRNSKAGREWYDWLPIHAWTTKQVFRLIRFAGQKPHWAYAAGMTRLSCCFCIMASRADLRTAARLRPDLYRRYVKTERRLGHTMNMARRPLEEVTGIPITDIDAAPQSCGNDPFGLGDIPNFLQRTPGKTKPVTPAPSTSTEIIESWPRN